MVVLKTRLDARPHTHIRTEIKYMNGKIIHEDKLVHSYTAPVAAMTVISSSDYDKYELKYSRDKDGGTEYFLINAVLTDEFRLTAHVFSCYCEPLNEDETPPF
jgi:hypothetical protein